MTLKIEKLGEYLGARIEGVDFSAPLTAAILDEIATALYQYQVISIPAAEMTPAQHIQIASHFGEPEHNETDQFARDAAHPEITVIDSDKGDRADSWHADETFLEHPPLVNLLHGKVIPQFGGDTALRSAACAYEGLSPVVKTMLEDLAAMHDYGHLYELGWQAGFPIAAMVGDALTKGLYQLHPVVKRHRVTGRPWLSVNPVYTRFIEKLNPVESEAILGMLFRQLEKPEYCYRHRWQPGDLLIWDQECVQHYAVRDFTGRRLVHRVAVVATRSTYKGVLSGAVNE